MQFPPWLGTFLWKWPNVDYVCSGSLPIAKDLNSKTCGFKEKGLFKIF